MTDRARRPPAATTRRAIRIAAAIEAFKGAVVVLAATGLLALVHHDLPALAAHLVEHTHLNPAAKYPRIFLDAAAHLQDLHLARLALGAAAYAVLRFVEAVGLWFGRAWAEVLAAVSGAVYLPFEVVACVRHPSALHAAVLAANLLVVAVMGRALWQRRQPPA